MTEIDKGTCGDCRFYDAHDKLRGQSKETWGVCSNFRLPVHYTISTNSPRQAFSDAGELEALHRFLDTGTTCFQDYSISQT